MTSGVLYIAFGESFREEARRSIASLRRVSPATRCAVVTESEWKDEPRPDHFTIREPIRSLYCKPKYIYTASPFERTFFVDSDTLFARDFEPSFGLLDFYDVALRFVGPHLNGPGGLQYHPWCSTGILGFRKNEITDRLFADWLARYEAKMAELGAAVPKRGLNEEPIFSVALAHSQARAVALGNDMMFNTLETIITYSPPVIVHGRDRNLDAIVHEIVDGWEISDYHPRLWMPNIKGLLPAGVRRSDPLLAAALVLRRAWNELKRAWPRRR